MFSKGLEGNEFIKGVKQLYISGALYIKDKSFLECYYLCMSVCFLATYLYIYLHIYIFLHIYINCPTYSIIKRHKYSASNLKCVSKHSKKRMVKKNKIPENVKYF